MVTVATVEFKPGTKEELLPNYGEDFPHIITRAAFREGDSAPWHWHKALELFYIPQGTLEYITPDARHVFTGGCGGLVNSNVLHMTRGHQVKQGDCHYLHLFDPALIAGSPGSRMEEKYVLPLTAAPQIELLVLDGQDPGHKEVLELLRHSFEAVPEEPGYELRIRSVLSEIWLKLLEIAAPQLDRQTRHSAASQQTKQMMVYIHERYGEKLTVKEIAAAACVSERACFDLFRRNLRTTPMEYVNSYRLRIACQKLTQTENSVTAISGDCGMNNSYFCQVFREATGFTPLEYRRFYRRHQHSMAGKLP